MQLAGVSIRILLSASVSTQLWLAYVSAFLSSSGRAPSRASVWASFESVSESIEFPSPGTVLAHLKTVIRAAEHLVVVLLSVSHDKDLNETAVEFSEIETLVFLLIGFLVMGSHRMSSSLRALATSFVGSRIRGGVFE